jgi:hypothetical protein
MYNPIEHELGRARQEELRREARLYGLAKAARSEARRSRRAAVAWELQRYGGRLRKLFRGL